MEMIYIGDSCHYLTVGKAYSVILSPEGYFRVNSDRDTTCSYNLENFQKNFIYPDHHKQYSQHKTEIPMTNQQKQLQSILAEVGINLTENQALAVMEANELLRNNDPSYSQVMEFKEKYKAVIQSEINFNEDGIRKFHEFISVRLDELECHIEKDGANIKQLGKEGIGKISAAYDNLASTYQRGLSQQDR